MKIKILGTKYTIEEHIRCEDENLRDCDGYCDKSIKLIVIAKKTAECEISDYEEYKRKIMRHEIIHAFLFESGLHENFEHPHFGYDETFIDWVAVQYPKMLKVFKKAGCI